MNLILSLSKDEAAPIVFSCPAGPGWPIFQAAMEPPADEATPPPDSDVADCPRCLKPPTLCVCEGIVPIDNRITLVVLQHPQEQDKALGTARLTTLHFRNAIFKIGLSWPSLA